MWPPGHVSSCRHSPAPCRWRSRRPQRLNRVIDLRTRHHSGVARSKLLAHSGAPPRSEYLATPVEASCSPPITVRTEPGLRVDRTSVSVARLPRTWPSTPSCSRPPPVPTSTSEPPPRVGYRGRRRSGDPRVTGSAILSARQAHSPELCATSKWPTLGLA